MEAYKSGRTIDGEGEELEGQPIQNVQVYQQQGGPSGIIIQQGGGVQQQIIVQQGGQPVYQQEVHQYEEESDE